MMIDDETVAVFLLLACLDYDAEKDSLLVIVGDKWIMHTTVREESYENS
jgi:hypothetical protein